MRSKDSSRITNTDIIIAASKILPEFNAPTGPRLTLENLLVQLPLQTTNGSPITIAAKTALFTSGGITATLDVKESQPPTWNPAQSKFSGNLSGAIGGFAIALEGISVALVKNALVAGGAKGKLRLPFFDQDLTITAALAQGGGWNITLATAPDQPVKLTLGTATNGLTIDLTAIELKSNPTGPSALALTGSAKLTLNGEASQAIPIAGLEITSDGKVNLKGGWLPLAQPISAKLGPFEAVVSRLGFTTQANGDREMAVDAAIKLSTSMPAGASAKGLRLRFDKSWNHLGTSFDGIGVEFTVPKVLHFIGDLAMKEGPEGTAFEGNVKVKLYPIDACVDGQVRFGSAKDDKGKPFKYFAIKLDLELSKGIKIFNTGLSLYGLTGLFAYNYAPNKTADEKWFAIPDGSGKPGWLQKAPPGVAELAKWAPKPGTLAFGAGVTVATNADNGKPFNGKFLLLVTLPGPVVFLEGRANLMKDRSELKKDAAFRAYSVFDGLAGTALFGLDARWRYPEGGELIDIAGSSEAFFDFHDAGKWYVKVGLETPESARIKAKIVSFLEAQAFLLIDAKRARTGGKVGYQFKKNFGPLDVGAQIWLSAVADISWSPPQLQAKAGVAGSFWAKAFGYGLSGSVTADVTVDAWRPFHVLANATATGSIPFYGSFQKSLAVQRTQPPNTPSKGKPIATVKDPPRVAAPLGAGSAAHALSPVVWPLALQPSLADDKGYLSPDWATAKPLDLASPPPDDAPVLPLDVRLDLTFARPVADAAQVGFNGTVSLPDDVIGNPQATEADRIATVRYALHKVELSRWNAVGKTWVAIGGSQVQGKGEKPLLLGDQPLFGSWVPDGAEKGVGRQQRLRLWAVDPLEALDSPSGVQKQAAANAGAGAAVFEPTQVFTTLVGFLPFAVGPVQAAGLDASGPPMPAFAWPAGLVGEIANVPWADGWAKALRVAAPPQSAPATDSTVDAPPWSAWMDEDDVWQASQAAAAPQAFAPLVVVQLTLAQPHVHAVALALAGAAPVTALAHAAGVVVASATWQPGAPDLKLDAPAIDRLTLVSGESVVLVRAVLAHTVASGPTVPPAVAVANVDNLASKMALLTAPGPVLPAHAQLRLTVALQVEQIPNPALGTAQKAILTQVMHFRTAGGPGLADLSLPTIAGQADGQQALPAAVGRAWPALGPLRVRARGLDGAVAHAAWLRASAAVPISAIVQRSRDGSEVAIIEPAAGGWKSAPAMAVTLAWNSGGDGEGLMAMPVAGSAASLQAGVVVGLGNAV